MISTRIKRARRAVRETLFATPIARVPLFARRYPSIHQSQPDRPQPLPSFALFGVVGAWHEGDVIAACVRNAFEQGCERVFLVDNASPDDTVAAAREAGAELISTFDAPFYDEGLRIHHMDSVTRFVTSQAAERYVWWLWLDADEFPLGPAGLTVRQYLQSLDHRFRLVGARYIEHFPVDVNPDDSRTAFDDPFGDMPWGLENDMGFCFLGHRKHPLVRHDAGQAPSAMGAGFHRLQGRTGVLEPAEPITVHHFPYRWPRPTLERLERLCGDRSSSPPRILGHEALEMLKESNSSRRLREYDAVYRGRWEDVEYAQRFGPLTKWTRSGDV